jgi:hypothetical protein
MDNLLHITPLSIGVVVIALFIFGRTFRSSVEKRNLFQRVFYSLGLTVLYFIGALLFFAIIFQVWGVTRNHLHRFF